MSKHKANIRKNANGDFYALIVRVDYDGEENVIHGYKGRSFTTFAAASKSVAKYMEKNGLFGS